MLYLNDLPTEAEGRIAKTTPRRSATGEISWDVDVAFEISNEDDAKSADEFVPGAHQAWVAGKSGGKGVVKSSGPSELMRVAFSIDGDQVASGHADLRNATVTVNGNEATLCTRFRVHGMLPNAACELVYRLDEIALLSVEAHQLSLFEPELSNGDAQAEYVEADAPQATDENGHLKGRLVVVGSGTKGEKQIAGIVVDELIDNGLLIQPMGSGKPLSVDGGTVNSEVMLITERGFDITKVEEHYTELSELAGTTPDWADIIESIGLLYAENELKPTDEECWPITTGVLRRAIEVATMREQQA